MAPKKRLIFVIKCFVTLYLLLSHMCSQGFSLRDISIPITYYCIVLRLNHSEGMNPLYNLKIVIKLPKED